MVGSYARVSDRRWNYLFLYIVVSVPSFLGIAFSGRPNLLVTHVRTISDILRIAFAQKVQGRLDRDDDADVFLVDRGIILPYSTALRNFAWIPRKFATNYDPAGVILVFLPLLSKIWKPISYSNALI